ncbi:afadin- and alpha-actinin-binding protein B [Patella vulgata]|uniref:afadin- and alpha-actinin-binding protein B n=1 Tax=Patella vulgata TaxID=6465 RepID=UPI00217FB22B|nr:afadin- and alpha-actinin-binding protein B [Patella vulgata]XP_050414074.1 afadin- and alpha-actinin-binding protein B [Patella vulgata]XP_050414076.1 afadin- and alpha-actinin-binding protein B [Patella vulgata]
MADWSLLQSVNASSAKFCTGDNVATCLAILSQELQVQGFPPLPIHSGGETDTVALINALHEIQTRYQKERNVREELENRHHRLCGDLEHQKGAVTRSKRHLEQANKELLEGTEKLRQITIKYKLLSTKLKTEKEEVKRLNLVLKSRDIKYKHEIKKNEQDLAKLKDRIHQLLSDKTLDRNIGLDMINVLQRADGKRGTWNTRSAGKQEEEMYQGMMACYEERHQELMCENTQLRDCLYTLQKNLASLINRPDLSETEMSPLKRASSNQSISIEEEDVVELRNGINIDELSDNGYFHLPLETIQRDIENKFIDTCEKLKKNLNIKRHVGTGIAQVNPPSSKQLMLTDNNAIVSSNNNSLSPTRPDQFLQVTSLQHQVTVYKDIIQKQEELLHLQVKAKEQENIERQQKLLDREKSEIEEKRIQYSLASAELERQRQKLEEEKYLILQQEFLSMSPFKDEQISPLKEETSLTDFQERDMPHVRLLPATPVFSPAKITTKHRKSTDMLRARISNMFKSDCVNERKKIKEQEHSVSLSSSDLSAVSTEETSSTLHNLTVEQLDILKQSILLQSLSKAAKTE